MGEKDRQGPTGIYTLKALAGRQSVIHLVKISVNTHRVRRNLRAARGPPVTLKVIRPILAALLISSAPRALLCALLCTYIASCIYFGTQSHFKYCTCQLNASTRRKRLCDNSAVGERGSSAVGVAGEHELLVTGPGYRGNAFERWGVSSM
jgi:hypothetical protein